MPAARPPAPKPAVRMHWELAYRPVGETARPFLAITPVGLESASKYRVAVSLDVPAVGHLAAGVAAFPYASKQNRIAFLKSLANRDIDGVVSAAKAMAIEVRDSASTIASILATRARHGGDQSAALKSRRLQSIASSMSSLISSADAWQSGKQGDLPLKLAELYAIRTAAAGESAGKTLASLKPWFERSQLKPLVEDIDTVLQRPAEERPQVLAEKLIEGFQKAGIQIDDEVRQRITTVTSAAMKADIAKLGPGAVALYRLAVPPSSGRVDLTQLQASLARGPSAGRAASQTPEREQKLTQQPASLASGASAGRAASQIPEHEQERILSALLSSEEGIEFVNRWRAARGQPPLQRRPQPQTEPAPEEVPSTQRGWLSQLAWLAAPAVAGYLANPLVNRMLQGVGVLPEEKKEEELWKQMIQVPQSAIGGPGQLMQGQGYPPMIYPPYAPNPTALNLLLRPVM